MMAAAAARRTGPAYRAGNPHWQRIEALAPRLLLLPGRVLVELLAEMFGRDLDEGSLVQLLESYCSLDPALLALLGADRFPGRLSPVPDDRVAA